MPSMLQLIAKAVPTFKAWTGSRMVSQQAVQPLSAAQPFKHYPVNFPLSSRSSSAGINSVLGQPALSAHANSSCVTNISQLQATSKASYPAGYSMFKHNSSEMGKALADPALNIAMGMRRKGAALIERNEEFAKLKNVNPDELTKLFQDNQEHIEAMEAYQNPQLIENGDIKRQQHSAQPPFKPALQIQLAALQRVQKKFKAEPAYAPYLANAQSSRPRQQK